jgi:DcuC family C4-dicarboxylate transporter
VGTAVTLLVFVVGGIAIHRKVDVRLVLAASAAVLWAAAGRAGHLLGEVAREMANPRTVVPICSAMGFAWVLKLTGCDQHLVHLLLKPVRRARVLAVPGGLLAGFLVNSAIVSQSSCAAVLGPVLIPLLRAAGLSAVGAGSVLLLGCSVGGELLNPGAAEPGKLAELTGLSGGEVVRRLMPFNFTAALVVCAVFCWLTRRWEAGSVADRGAEEAGGEAFRIHLLKAAVPLLPLAILMFAPNFVHLDAAYTKPVDLNGPASILAAMLIGVTAAVLTAPKTASQMPAAFFEGAGFAYTHVISLIVLATVFMESVKANNVIESITGRLAGRPGAALLSAMLIPLGMAAVCGSGIAPAIATMKALLPSAEVLHLDAARLGGLISVSAQLGRTMSPVAAVAIMSATLSGTSQVELVKRTAPALLTGWAVLVLLALTGVL